MDRLAARDALLLSLQRSLLGAVHPQLRQASIEADYDALVVRVRFEYDGEPAPEVRESCSLAAEEVVSDFPAPWEIDEQHVVTSSDHALSPLKHVCYRRAEPGARA
jgi:hypothetical protein